MKKVVCAILASAVMALALAGCTSGGDSGTGSSASGSSSSASSSASSSSASSSASSSSSASVSASNTDYLSWKAADWNKASQADKEAAAMACMKYVFEQSKLPFDEAAVKPQIPTLVTNFDTSFKADKTNAFSLKDIGDVSAKLLTGSDN